MASKVPVKDERPGTIGQLLPNVTAKVVDVETGALLPPLADGEICIKTPSVCAATWGGRLCYWKKKHCYDIIITIIFIKIIVALCITAILIIIITIIITTPLLLLGKHDQV